MLETMNCPRCGAPLHFDNEEQEYCFCSHCGIQVYKEDKHFDKKIQLEKQKIDNEHKEEMMAGVILAITMPLFIIGLIAFYIFAASH
jgi:hypothetical protein